jgi:hypothetical protein
MLETVRPVTDTRGADERSGTRSVWLRRAGMLVLAAVPVLALLNVLGQRATSATVSSPAATLTVHAPATVRAGLLFQAKITITAHQTLRGASLVLGNGWFDGLTINTSEPQASSETNGPDGGVTFSLGTVKPGAPYVEYLEFQVNPTSISRRSQPVALRADGTQLLAFDHTMTIIP